MSKLFASLLLVLASTILGGATIDTWYSWFVAGPTGAFPELNDITFVQALGVGLFVGYFTYGLAGMLSAVMTEEERNQGLAMAYALTAIGWVFALVYHFILI